MNAHSTIKPDGAFAGKLEAIADKFQAWRVVANRMESAAIDLPACASIAEAVNAAISAAFIDHKDTLAILHTEGRSGKRTVHFYAIKRKSSPTYRWNPETLTTERSHPLYPTALFSMSVSAFAPIEPWKWTPGADVVGIDCAQQEARLAAMGGRNDVAL